MPAKALGPLLAALPMAPNDLRINQRLATLHTRAGRFTEAALAAARSRAFIPKRIIPKRPRATENWLNATKIELPAPSPLRRTKKLLFFWMRPRLRPRKRSRPFPNSRSRKLPLKFRHPSPRQSIRESA